MAINTMKLEVIDPVKLVWRIHKRLTDRILRTDSPMLSNTYYEADGIVVDELKAMQNEAITEILARRAE